MAETEILLNILKTTDYDMCQICKNRIECKREQCEKYQRGAGDVDGNFLDWEWTCMDFDYGTCFVLENTPCNECIENDWRGFEWLK